MGTSVPTQLTPKFSSTGSKGPKQKVIGKVKGVGKEKEKEYMNKTLKEIGMMRSGISRREKKVKG